ncbi:MAG: cupin domain-containing protein [Patescibacteria group bacterium]
MDGFHTNIEKDTLENELFRKVLYTTPRSQLVLMTLRAGEEIGLETHAEHDQFIRIEAGEGKAFLNDATYDLADGSALVIPAGTKHNIVNTGSGSMRLYTLYTPPEHPDGTIHATKAEADAAHH